MPTLRAPQIEMRFFENARDILLVLDADSGRVVDANAAALAAYGYTRDDPRDVPEQMAAANAGGLLFEALHRRKDGSVFDVEVSSRGYDEGPRKYLLSVIRDISQRKQLELERSALIETTGRTLALRKSS